MSTVSKGFASSLFKRIASMFAEKPTVKADDFEMEHLLLYHGLAGSSPDNMRQFKDVRDDMKMAVQTNSSSQMAINLRLPPLWWNDRLKQIIDEINDRDTVIRLLTPKPRDEQMTFNDIPLLHDDWRVRANASIILAHLKASESAELIAASLADTISNTRTAFPHQAYALGTLGTDASRAALLTYLHNEEPWIRVNSAGALAQLTALEICLPLMESLLVDHPLSDHSCVAVARFISLSGLLSDDRRLVRYAGCELIVGVVAALEGSFPKDAITDLAIEEYADQLAGLISSGTDNSVCVARAVLVLGDWLAEHSPAGISDSFQSTLDQIGSAEYRGTIKQIFENTEKPQDELASYERRCAIIVAGRLGIKEVAPAIAANLGLDRTLLDDSVEALGKLGDPATVANLTRAAEELVDISDRTSQVLSKHPIAGEDEEIRRATRTYWLIVKALQNLPNEAALSFLTRIVADCAPDIRAQAFNSIIAICESGYVLEKSSVDTIKAALSQALGDPALEVRKTALKGVRILEVTDCVQKVVALTGAKEVSLAREAFTTLSELAKKGHKQLVSDAVGRGLKTEPDLHKRKALKEFLDSLS